MWLLKYAGSKMLHLFWSCYCVEIILNNLLKFLENKNQVITMNFEIVCFGVGKKWQKYKCNDWSNIDNKILYFSKEN